MLFVSDLDGTLLNSSGQLSQYTIFELNRMLAKGLQFTIATARSSINALELTQAVNLNLPIICQNGAIIHDSSSGKHLQVIACDGLAIQQILTVLHECGIAPMLAGIVNGKDFLYITQPENEAVRRYRTNRIVKGDPRLDPIDFSDFIAGQVIALNAIDREDSIRQALHKIQNLTADFTELVYEDSYFNNWWWLTLASKHATKGAGCKFLLNKLGLDSSDLVVFGDHINDLPMFSLASHKLAVYNAMPEVQLAADCRIGTNDEDSVVKYIAQMTGL